VQRAAAAAVAALCVSHSFKTAELLTILCSWLMAADQQVKLPPLVASS
jgi:hypothetical protein